MPPKKGKSKSSDFERKRSSSADEKRKKKGDVGKGKRPNGKNSDDDKGRSSSDDEKKRKRGKRDDQKKGDRKGAKSETNAAKTALLSIGSGLNEKRSVHSKACKTRCLQPFGRQLRRFCEYMAANGVFSGLTTVLTFYALFGDDMRLLFTEKPMDVVFDWVTGSAMAIFTLEITVCAIGRKGYFNGFFFWLDIMSTVTIVLDITVVSERMFGDSVSSANTNEGQTGTTSEAGSDSSEAARAARMSRAGTKASRIVRLVRLVKLLKVVRKLGAKKKEKNLPAKPGMDWDDEEDVMEKDTESAVSKKLSEMTTRVVILLVLVIMLALPFFQASFIGDPMENNSAQFGLNMLYRRYRQGVIQYQPQANASALANYMGSLQRELYENDFRNYIYFHSWFCDLDTIPADKKNPLGQFSKLFYIGVDPPNAPNANLLLPSLRPGQDDWNSKWSGDNWAYYQCKVPVDVQQMLSWNSTSLCLSGAVRGVSMATGRDSSLDCPNGLRYQERQVLIPTVVSEKDLAEGAVFMAVYDYREGSRFEACLNTLQTLFICFLLGFGAIAFSNDANKLVLKPIETMISNLEKIRSNPLGALTIGSAEQRRQDAIVKLAAVEDDDVEPGCQPRCRRRFRRCCKRNQGASEPEPMETAVLEKTIAKIGSLLALGFGEAGAAIIRHNVIGSETRPLQTTLPGRRVDAIFAYCEVRNFLNIADLLGEQVMIFINTVAWIVHSTSSDSSGYPIVNSGGAFLLVFRLSGQTPSMQERLADMSLVSMGSVVAQIAKSAKLSDYKSHPKLVKRLPNFRCRVGIGLHYGWAIEGTVGSEFKIDAAYLGPSIAVAAGLSDVTVEFGCLVLVSDVCRSMMSASMAKLCRLVDNVILPGSESNFKLFCFDLDDFAVEAQAMQERKSFGGKTRAQEAREKLERQRKKRERWTEGFDTSTLIIEDADLVAMRMFFTEELSLRYNMAYLNYTSGDWTVARELLEKTRYLLGREDGPSIALLKYIKGFSHKAPMDWRGYRVLKRSH